MADITDAGPRLRAMNDALADNDRLRAEIERLWMTARERHCLRKAVEMLANDADREDGIARSQIAAVLSDVANRIG